MIEINKLRVQICDNKLPTGCEGCNIDDTCGHMLCVMMLDFSHLVWVPVSPTLCLHGFYIKTFWFLKISLGKPYLHDLPPNMAFKVLPYQWNHSIHHSETFYTCTPAAIYSRFAISKHWKKYIFIVIWTRHHTFASLAVASKAMAMGSFWFRRSLSRTNVLRCCGCPLKVAWSHWDDINYSSANNCRSSSVVLIVWPSTTSCDR